MLLEKEMIRYVIGVVKDFNFESLHKPVDALLIGYARDGNGNGVSLKIDAAHIHEAINQLTKTWKNIVPEVPLQHSFVDERIAEQYGNEQKREGIFLWLLGIIAAHCFSWFIWSAHFCCGAQNKRDRYSKSAGRKCFRNCWFTFQRFFETRFDI